LFQLPNIVAFILELQYLPWQIKPILTHTQVTIPSLLLITRPSHTPTVHLLHLTNTQILQTHMPMEIQATTTHTITPTHHLHPLHIQILITHTQTLFPVHHQTHTQTHIFHHQITTTTTKTKHNTFLQKLLMQFKI
jgi:hypothetical protein